MINKESRQDVRIRKHLRVREKISGTSETPRLCVFRSNKNIEAQIIDDSKGITICSVSTVGLKIKNGHNIEGATKLGEAIALRAKEKGIEKVVFDRGGYIYHGRVKAVAEAARNGGLKF